MGAAALLILSMVLMGRPFLAPGFDCDLPVLEVLSVRGPIHVHSGGELGGCCAGARECYA